MIIIKAKLEDIDIVKSIGERTFYESFSNLNTEENMAAYMAIGFSKDKIRSDLARPESEYYLATLNEETIGYLKLNFGEAQTDIKDPDSVEIERIYVQKNYQGKKIGEALFSKALGIARYRKANYIWLGVWEVNTGAIRFYKKLGFNEFGRHAFMLGSDEQTDIMMKLELEHN